MSAPELVKRLRVWRAEVTAADDARFRMIGEAADMIEALPPERDAVLEEAAQIAENACLVPPDGGSPTEAETAVADEAAKRIRALKSPTPQTAGREE